MRPFRAVPWALVLAAAAPACDIPVFRYALVHWPADAYEAIVYHYGPLGSEETAVVETLERHARDPLNLRVRRVDLAVEKEASPVASKLPWVVLRYPGSVETRGILWEGRPADLSLGRLTDSPARREVAMRILEGESAVWIFLESGDRAKDEAAAALLGARLRDMEGKLKLPGAPEEPVSPPLRLAFSVLRLSRADPTEEMLVRMLIRSEEGLESVAEPMAFPVFGRGRKLEALVGKGISGDNVAEYCAFLAGPCSCQVKLQNPGIDLLLSAEWESFPGGTKAEAPPLAPPPVPAPSRPVPYAWVGLAVAAAGTALAGVFVLRRARGA
jgi:hypothetical protein